MMTRFQRMRGDDGVSLVMALVFIVIVGLFVTGALEKNQATSLSGQQVRLRSQVQYTVDAGIDRSLAGLRAELRSGAPTSCTDPSDADATGVIVLNGQSTDYSCTTLAGRAATSNDAASTNFAVVVTSTNSGALTTQSGVSQDLQVAGSMYLNGRVTNGDIGKPIEITDGDLVSPASTDCKSNIAALSNISLTGTGQLRQCTEQTLSQALPTVDLPPAPTSTLPSALVNGVQVITGTQKCTVWYPGLYTSPPALANDSKNYFVSGLYYFRNIGQWTIDDANIEVVAGARGLATDTPVPGNDCAGMTDTTALGASAATATAGILPTFSFGATWVFGGNSRFDVKKGSVTMFSPPAGSSTVPVSLVGASAYTDSSYLSQPVSTDVLTGGGANSSMEINGKVFAPASAVEVFSTNGTVAAARGGVVGYEVQLKASAAGSDALVISASNVAGNPPPPFRTVQITSVDSSGTSSARHRAVATMSNFSPFTVKVLSWRAE